MRPGTSSPHGLLSGRVDPGQLASLDGRIVEKFVHGTHGARVQVSSESNPESMILVCRAVATCDTCRAKSVSVASVPVSSLDTGKRMLEAMNQALKKAWEEFLGLPDTCEDTILLLMAQSVLES